MYSREVVCGPNLVAGAVIAPDSACNMACAGNATYATQLSAANDYAHNTLAVRLVVDLLVLQSTPKVQLSPSLSQ